MGRERIDFRIEPDILDELEAIAGREGAGSRSEALRAAVYHYVDSKKDDWNTDVLNVRIPKRLGEKLNLFIMNGDAENADQAVVLALTEWCKGLDSYYTGHRDELERAVAENIRSDGARDGMKQRVDDLRKR